MPRTLSTLFFAICTVCYSQSPIPVAYRIDTVAGINPTRERVNSRDEYMGYPDALAIDSKGNIYYNDISRAIVRKIAPEGIITTFAGNGTAGFSGDGGLATAAQMNGEASLAIDRDDNLIISDTYNMRLRKVTADGIINTISGSGLFGFSGDGGPAKAARTGLVDSVAIDGKGNIYVATVDNRIRRVGLDGIIQTAAGTGLSGFSGDGGLATAARVTNPQVGADQQGNFYVLDSYRIRKVTPDGIITTIAGTGVAGFNGEGDGGPATAARIGIVLHSAPDGQGGLYLADVASNRIRHIRPDGIMETVAGTGAAGYSGDGGPATKATLFSPIDVAVGPDGSLFIADGFNHVIRRVTPDGTISTYAGQARYAGDSALAVSAVLNDPLGVALDNRGNIFISENFGKRIRRVDPAGIITTSAAALLSPGMLAADGAGNLFFADSSVVWRATPAGVVTRFVGGLGGAPQGLAVDTAGNLFVADTGNNVIRKVSPDGTVQTFAGTGTRGFAGDGGPAAAARLSSPEGLAFDAVGNLYVADYGNLRVRRITPAGTITTVAGNGALSFLDSGWPEPQGDGGPAVLAQLFGPERIAVDANGSLFIGEHNQAPFYYGNRIRRVTPDGIIDTVAGTGEYGFGGDGGLARDAQLHWVSQMAADSSGKVYFADRLNDRVRVLTPIYGSSRPQSALLKR